MSRSISRLGSLRAVAVASVGLCLMWVGNAATAADKIHPYPYNDRIDFSDLAGDMLAVPLSDVIGSAVRDAWFPLLNLIMVSSIVLAAVALASVAVNRTLLIIASIITGPYGLLGVVTLFGLVADGEWIGEGWFQLNIFAAWSVMLWLVTLLQSRPTMPATARSLGAA